MLGRWDEKYADFQCIIQKEKNGVFSAVKTITSFHHKKKDLLDCSVSPCQRLWIFPSKATSRFWNDWIENEIDNFHFTWTELGKGKGIEKFVPSFTSSGEITVKGVKVKLSNTVSGLTINLLDGDCDVVKALGSDLDFYCDEAFAPGQLYSTGAIEFYIGHDAKD